MLYIYTAPNCPRCHDLMRDYDLQGIKYRERSGDRLKTPADDRDEIDVDAFVKLSRQNMIFPVEVNA